MADKLNWNGKPVAEFLHSIASDRSAAQRFQRSPGAMVDGAVGLSAAQRSALKSGGLRAALTALAEDSNGRIDGIYLVSANSMTCGHADCSAFQAHAGSGS
jgi:hypothetical protein